ncbi:MAG TPA: potassium-transporting ATPase subunit KdpA [Ignavibacteriaceae bacterium]|nr:potassium-transporting ATPase subunit KdpA [Ignavibacteriaceae bacterium]
MNYFLDVLQFLLFLVVLTSLSFLIGGYFYKVIKDEKNLLSLFVRPFETFIYKFLKINMNEEMKWKTYLFSIMIFSFFSFIVVLVIQLFQNSLPLNPEKLPNVEFFLAFNTAISFMTNTNWQSYSGETTLSYFTQMIALTVQNFVSAGVGISVLLALARAIAIRKGSSLGNFWTDLTKTILYLLLPLSFILSILLISQGVVQTFSPYIIAHTLEGSKQIIPLGPAASQIAIKQLGTNGGGFFGVNSAFPFENPTPFSNFLQVFSILLIPASLVFTYGKIIGNKKHAWTIYSVMIFVFISGVIISYWSELSAGSSFQTTQMLEGKEVRFGIFNSTLWSVATTVASNGSVNSMHSSLSPIAGFVAMLNMQLGEIIFGGVGSGMYGMFLFILLTVFISGLMVGRTPEYFGKKIESFEIKGAIVGILIPCILILTLTAIGVTNKEGLSSTLNKGPHAFSEILYAFTSGAANNGSAFSGLNANTIFYNVLIVLAMLIGRFGVIIPVLAIAGNLVKKNIAPETAGTLKTDNTLFAFLLLSIILVVGALTFFPALSLGPILEQLLVNQGITF